MAMGMAAQRPANTPRAAKWRKLIHVAKRQLGLDEETYRTVLRTVGGAESTSHMDMAHLIKVLDHLKRAGFRVKPTGQQSGRTIYIDKEQARKVRALWLFLYTLGVVKDPSERALTVYVKRVTGRDHLRFVGDYMPLIESLKSWAMRHLPEQVDSMINDLVDMELSPDAGEHAAAAIRRLATGHSFDAYWHAWVHCMRALGRPIPPEVAPKRKGAA